MPLKAESLPCPLDPILDIPNNWAMSPDVFEEKYSKGENRLFVWLTKDRTRAKISRKLYANAEIDITAFDGEVKVQEAIVDFAEGKLNLVTVSIFNRGDGGEIAADDFSARFKAVGKAIGSKLGTAPRRKEADSQSGLLTEGYSWYSQGKG